MRLTILGSGTNIQPTRAAAGYLVRTDQNILLDFGPRTLSNLIKTGVDRHRITHILISHFHADHFSDFITFFFDAMVFTKYQGGKRPPLTVTLVARFRLLARTKNEERETNHPLRSTGMANPIDFYFDFSSPYGYFASLRIDEIAARHGRAVTWRPILLGAAFKITGGQPLPTIPLKGSYAAHDLARCARLYKVPFRMPTKFPVGATAPSRAFYWTGDRDPLLAKKLAQALFHAYFAEDRDISNPELTGNVAAKLGVDTSELSQALNDPAVKERLKTELDAAIERGVFGSSYIVVDGEPFWGADRLDQVDKWLETGGW